MKVVCWLGGFHLLISFLESIRKVMENCNFKLFQVVYSSTAVVHMLLGNTCVAALGAHFLGQFALDLLFFNSFHL